MPHGESALVIALRGRLRHLAAGRQPGHPAARRLVVRAVSRRPPPDLPGVPPDAYRAWTPDGQARALAALREREASNWRPFYCPVLDCDGHPHDEWEFEHARADQRPPAWRGNWLTFLLRGGRGSGKTRTGSEVTHRVTERVARIGLVAATGPDLRDTMVEGVSGILATSPPGRRPLWEPSKKKLTWPNGCIAQGFSAEEPDRLRGPEYGFVWGDEPFHWAAAFECWDNIMFGLREKVANPKVVLTSTPLPTRFTKERIADPRTVDRQVSTYANLHNLTPVFRDAILAKYEGTRVGRQELHGEILEDVEGALWTWDMFVWVDEPPPLARVVVGVDPAGTTNKKSDETGIIVVGLSPARDLYVLADYSGKYSPAGWASKANEAYTEFEADAIVCEKNYGGDMVKHTLETSGYRGARVKPVTSRRGKDIRAEPVVALYEKKRVYHVGQQGDLADLEDEQTSWVPGHGASPNRLDAMVHASTDLAAGAMPAEIAVPRGLDRDDAIPLRFHRPDPFTAVNP